MTEISRIANDHLFELKPYTRVGTSEYYKKQFQTNMKTCRYMVSLLPKKVKTVLEPTPGNGNLVMALEGYDVTAPEDFFLLKKARYDAVVMNPPFSSKYAMMDNAPAGINKQGMRLGYYLLTECMKRSDIVIALMPWFTISDSDVRLRHLKKFGLKSLTALPRKTFEYSRIQTVVLELVKGYKKETVFKIFE